MKTLLLSRNQIKKLLRMEEVLRCVKEAFLKEKESLMPPKTYLILKKGDFRAMPVSKGKYAGIKWVNVHSDNVKRKIPSVMALFILNDAKTGFPLAIMDATEITNFRTGACAGIATQLLSRKNSCYLGLLGCGAQAYTQFLAIKLVRNIKKVILYDINVKRTYLLEKFIRRESSAEVIIAKDLSLFRECDVISTTTPSRQPVLFLHQIKEGVHINAMGADAPGKHEIDDEILKKATIYVDNIEQAIHSGEINVPLKTGNLSEKNIKGTLGEVMRGEKSGRLKEDEITLFDSTGIAIHDIAVASWLYQKALRSSCGKLIKLI